jgi:Mrp family chromosome partitioning ATPase
VLATLVGQVVFVVRAGLTPRHAVYDALDGLGEGKLVGFVFNQSILTTEEDPSDYYGYGGYGASTRYGTYGKFDGPVGEGADSRARGHAHAQAESER